MPANVAEGQKQEAQSGFLWAGMIKDLRTLMRAQDKENGGMPCDVGAYLVSTNGDNSVSITSNQGDWSIKIDDVMEGESLQNAPVIKWNRAQLSLDNTDLQEIVRTVIAELQTAREAWTAQKYEAIQAASGEFSERCRNSCTSRSR